jgi:cell division protein FtsZ
VHIAFTNRKADSHIIFGALIDDTLDDNISITVLATGFAERGREKEMKAKAFKNLNENLNDSRSLSRKTTSKRTTAAREETPTPVAPSRSASPADDKVPDFLKNLKKRR